jgi:uncharacterized membrane protein YgcG
VRRALVLLVLGWLCLGLPALAQERILAYDVDLVVEPDGGLLVTENIRVRAEGQQIRRGIYRDFPVRYKDRSGNNYVVDFQMLGVERDGRPEAYFTENLFNGVRINTGGDDFLPVPADITFTLRYRTTRQLGFFEEHDELYWNATGLGWDFPIDSATARVRLPGEVPSAQMQLYAYTGPSGAQGRDWAAESPEAGVASFRTTRGLGPREGLTIVVGFPKGLVAQPSRLQRLGLFLRDNGGVLVGLAGLGLLILFYLWRWNRFGRDPAAGPTFPRYAPPEGFTPGELRMLRRMRHDNDCFSADIVDMAVRGYLHIHQGGKKASEPWKLVRQPGASVGMLTAHQQAVAEKLFQGKEEVVLKNTEAAQVGGGLREHLKALTKKLTPRYYVLNGGSQLLGWTWSILVGFAAVKVAAGSGVIALVVLAVLTLATHITFGYLLKAPTPEGRKLMDEIEGLRMYLGVAERDELKAAPVPGGEEPSLDAGRYEALLPFAMALDVEGAWTERFTRAVGAAQARESSPTWYHGRGPVGAMGLASMSSSLGKALSQQISSSSSPPGSSSGGGGGGSSGGGGGGGGGGGR